MEWTAQQLADRLGCAVIGDGTLILTDVRPLGEAVQAGREPRELRAGV